MHNIDSTRLEFSPEYGSQEQEAETYETYEGSFEIPMTEAEEEVLAAELLSVSNEEEMDQFLGGLFKKITGAAGKFLRNGGPLAGALKGIAAKALPVLGGALGTAIPIPGLGTALGSAVGSAASRLLQSEAGQMEQMEAEEQEEEIARRYIRLATSAIRRMARGRLPANPMAAATVALRNAVRDLSRTYIVQPDYRSCPPCPVCPTCSQPTPAPAPDMTGADMTGGGDASGIQAPAPTAPAQQNPELQYPFGGQGEFPGEVYGEHEGEAESYETNYEAPAAPYANGNRTGRWVRRGRKIVLYGL